MSESNIKILLIGDTAVGKTSLIHKYAKDEFEENYTATIGIELITKDIVINDAKIKLKIWDTSGQERFKSLTANFYRGTDGVLFVYDVSNPDTFDSLKNWMKEVLDYNSNVKKILVGNKIDLKDKSRVEKNSINKFISKYNMESYETSAKTGENVDLVFSQLTKLIMEDGPSLNKESGQKLDQAEFDENDKKNKKKKCC